MLPLIEAVTAGLRGVLLIAVVVLVGGPPTLSLVVYPLADSYDVPTTLVDRLVLWLVGGSLAAGFLAVTALLLPSLTHPISPSVDGLERLLAAEWGTVWFALTSVGLAVGFTAVLGATGLQAVPRRGWLRVVTCGGSLVLLCLCLTGYSAAVPDARVAVALKFGHMAGAAIWMGGLIVLATAGPALLRAVDDGAKSQFAACSIRRFSPVAVAGVTLASVAGLVIAVWHVPGVGSLDATPYGVVLAVKVVLVLAAASLGGLNRVLLLVRLEVAAGRRIQRGDGRLDWLLPWRSARQGSDRESARSFVRAVRLELAVIVVVMALSVLLTASLSLPSGDAALGPSASEFQSVLLLGAMGVAAVGFTTFGYEMTTIREDRSSA